MKILKRTDHRILGFSLVGGIIFLTSCQSYDYVNIDDYGYKTACHLLQNGTYDCVVFDSNGNEIGTVQLDQDINFHGTMDGHAINGDGKSVRVQMEYEHGSRNGASRIYYESGMVRSITHYKNDIKDWIEQDYDKQGNLIRELNYSKGKMNGQATYFFLNGATKSSESYKDDMRHGDFIRFNSELDRDTLMYTSYQDGKIIEHKIFNKNGKLGFHVKRNQIVFWDKVTPNIVEFDRNFEFD